MSKKNNKNRDRAYAEFLKKHNDAKEKEMKEKQARRDANRITKDVMGEICDMTLNNNENKMEVEKQKSKKKMRTKSKKRYS